MQYDLTDINEVLLVDTAWIMYRGIYAYSEMGVTVDGTFYRSGHVYAVAQHAVSFHKMADRLIIFARDNFPKQKLAQVQTYKSGRPEDEFKVVGGGIHKSFPLCAALLANLPRVQFVEIPWHEADDVIAILAKRMSQLGVRVTIFSGDDDFLQLTGLSNVRIARKIDNGILEYLSENHCYARYGVDPEHLPTLRTIIGDKSDNIAGIPRFPRDLARAVAKVCPDFVELPKQWEKIKELCNTSAQMKYLTKLRAQYARLLENYYTFHNMASLDYSLEPQNVRSTISPSHVADMWEIGGTTRQKLKIPQRGMDYA